MKRIGSYKRIVFIIISIAFMIFAIKSMYSTGPGSVVKGKLNLSGVNYKQKELVTLDGQWEFYWNQLLTSKDFLSKHKPTMDSFMKVPGTWDDSKLGNKVYPHYGFATYRLRLNYPFSIKDPALRIQNVASAYKLFANGRLITEVGKISSIPSNFKDDEKPQILDLPKDTKELELIIQVASMRYPKGGIRETPKFGSKEVLVKQKNILLALQMFFIGSVFIFGIYYTLLFLLQTKNKTALIFSILCYITALRSLIWGEGPIMTFLPNVSYDMRTYINYFTGYNYILIMILFVLSIYPMEFRKKTLVLILAPNLFFEALLLTPTTFISEFTNYLYILILVQLIYIVGILVKAVLHKRDNAIMMFIALYIFVLAIIEDILHYKGIGGINISYMFLYGNFVVIIVMSYVQAKQQASNYKKLALYNGNIVEAGLLKDKVMATEMSFLQAQIKPHFLYNALNAIANVCETDGEKASKLILDLGIYLRGSLEFNNLDKMASLEKELEFIKTYFNIEQARFGQKIQFIEDIKIPLDYQIPVLILQPLVENAVRHGISKKLEGGWVIVRVMQLPEGVGIEIEDNGIGIESRKLPLLLNEEGDKHGVGLLNIHHRLLRIYGKGLEISSEVGRGTLVRLIIPERRKKV